VRKLLFMMGVSLDGYIEGPNREIDWHRIDEELHQFMNDELGTMGAFLEGRRTYELMEDYWPTAGQDPSASPIEVEFAGIWERIPKIVYSRTLEQAGENAVIAREVDPAAIAELKAEPGGDLMLGGADLLQTFLPLGLIDEFRIYVHPVLIGRGRRLFEPGDFDIALELVDTHTFGNGVVRLQYRPVDDA
jgi:dihydrofolate reductase